MSVLLHNELPQKWWQCSHPVVCLTDLIGLTLSFAALFFIDTLFGKLYALIVIVQFAASIMYHRRYYSERRKVLQSVDHIAIGILILGTPLPYFALSFGSGFVVWLSAVVSVLLLLAIVLARGVSIKIAMSSAQGVLFAISVLVMTTVYSDLSTASLLFWLGSLLFALQLPLLLIGTKYFNNIARELQHIFLLLPATQIHVWLVAYLF